MLHPRFRLAVWWLRTYSRTVLQRNQNAVPDLLDRLKTALADRYAIQEELGAGGMATVYLAEDLKLHRKVAVKVLRPELAAALGPERFLREIEIAAKLHHPHILALHDSGEAGGFLYYVMPYVEGESLRDRLHREKQLPVEDALQIAREVADALGSAHRHDVIHRDIKPENILLEEGHAVVADFGIARAIHAAGGEKLTETGLAVGTPAYMSPEQAMGSQDLDGRSDLYSLGCVLYEMLGGEPPFTGATVESIVHQQIAVEPHQVTALRPAVPAEVVAALSRVLSKAPADRFSPAGQFAEALERQVVPQTASTTATGVTARNRLYAVGAVTLVAVLGVWLGVRALAPSDASGDVPRIVVLPLENLSASEEQYFADGMTEEITSRLAGISGLRIISRQTAIQYKGSTKTAQEIAEELDVDYVLEGTVRTDRTADGGGQVRITPQLIRASDDTHLWSEIYTADLVPGEIFSIQTQIAERITQSMDIVLREPELQRLAAQPTDNQEAYDYYLRGKDYYGRSQEAQDIQIATQMYQKAVEVDPEFALAYARLSIAHSAMWWYFYDRTQERLALAKEAVEEALALDPDLPEAHGALGWYHYWGYLEYDRALAEFAIAQKSQPNSSDLFVGIGAVQRRQGKMREALANFIKASELDPRSARRARDVADTYQLVRNPVEASRYFDRAILLTPDWAIPYAEKARWVNLRLEGSPEKARAVLEEARSVGLAEDPVIAYTWVLLDILDGHHQAALDRLGVVSLELLHQDQWLYVPKAQLYAQIYGLMGNRERERAYYDSASTMLETRIQQRPDDERLRSALGIAYAGLGREEDAIREGELAVELLPMSKEAWRGAYRVEDLARIYTMVGEDDAATDELQSLLAVPSPMAVPWLRIDPIWDPLRDNPRFQALLAKYEN